MDVAATMKSCDDDVVDVGSRQAGPIAKVFCLLWRAATRVRVLQKFAVRSPESKLQKMPGAHVGCGPME